MKHENMDARLIGQASWICPTELVSVPTFTKRFRIGKRPRSATLAITGLGYFEFTINGESITDERLIPPASDYFQREFKEVTYPVIDAFTHRIYYHTYPIEKYLHEGENILEVTCGGGFFVQKERVAEGKMHYADVPMCLFAIDTGDDVILSDGSESWRENEIRTSRLFIGETIDYTFAGAEQRPVRTLPHPDTILSPAIGSMDKIKRTIKPKLLSEGEGSRIYDLGENVSALVSLTTNAPFGARYTLRFAENINACGALDFHSTGAVYKGTSGELQIMQDIFITDGKRRTFLPHFTWHAFRYFEVAGDLDAIEDVTVCVIHADVNPKCTFSSDSEGLNFLFDAYLRTTLSNYHGSYPSDCPHRERLGYTGDGQITARSAMMMLDTKDLYRKWIQDILDSQDKNTGHVQHTAPFQGGGGGPGGWGSAIVTVPYAFAKEYGFDDILLTARPAMYRWLAFTKDCTEGGLVVREREGGWCLGDWCALPEAVLPEPFVNTCWFVHAIRLYRELSCFLSHTPEEELDMWEEEALAALKEIYPDLKEKGSAMVYAAWIGIDAPSRVMKFYQEKVHFDTGFLATDILCDVLFQNGYADVAYQLLSSESLGSFLYMKRHGATTLWENWSGRNSHSHPMFGACARQIFEGILGIRQPYGAFGYEKVTIAPTLPEKMSYASGTLETPKGKITVSLRREGDRVIKDIVAPEFL